MTLAIDILLSLAIIALAAPLQDQPKKWVAGGLAIAAFVLALIAWL